MVVIVVIAVAYMVRCLGIKLGLVEDVYVKTTQRTALLVHSNHWMSWLIQSISRPRGDLGEWSECWSEDFCISRAKADVGLMASECWSEDFVLSAKDWVG